MSEEHTDTRSGRSHGHGRGEEEEERPQIAIARSRLRRDAIIPFFGHHHFRLISSSPVSTIIGSLALLFHSARAAQLSAFHAQREYVPER